MKEIIVVGMDGAGKAAARLFKAQTNVHCFEEKIEPMIIKAPKPAFVSVIYEPKSGKAKQKKKPYRKTNSYF